MAEKKGGGKGSEKKKKKKPRNLYALYALSSDKLQRKNRFCPKCASGSFMAVHKDRLVCGKCHYAEFSRKSAP